MKIRPGIGFLLLLAFSLCLGASKTDLPLWKNSVISGDTLFFIQEEGQRPSASLLFVPKVMPVLMSATREIRYEPGKDYLWSAGSRQIDLPVGSRIPFKKREEMYVDRASAKLFLAVRGRPEKGLLHSEGYFFHDLEVVTDYETKERWQGFVPPRQPKLLPKTMAKLRQRQPIRLVVLGDSISTGANASAAVGAKPHLPGYAELVAQGLERRGASQVVLKNLSVGGQVSEWGATQLPAVIDAAPDILIIAFGMNDAHKVPPEEFAAHIKTIIEKTRAAKPECEFILVASMLPNAEWASPQMDRFPAYRDELKSFEDPGIAVADVTSLWMELLKQKSFYDLTGNGVNHPNDFGHKIYSQVILELLAS